MRILVGIDVNGVYRPALNLAARLKFPDANWTLAHSVELPSVPPVDALLLGAPNLLEAESERGAEALSEASDAACAFGIPSDTVLLAGNPAKALVNYADHCGADLVCVQSERKGWLGSFFLGSVSRGLAIAARQAVLISKGKVGPTGPIRLVWATDGSEYASRCLGKLIAMRPQGVSTVRVISGLRLHGHDEHQDRAQLDSSIVEHLVAQARARVDADVARLIQAGYNASGEVADMTAHDAIRKEMMHADLLVVGAQGHGFMHRLVLGSTSLHQVVVEPHPVLIIRS